MAGLDRESTRRSAKAGDLTLNYYEAGEPTSVGGGLPLVMLHGGGPGASAWSNFGSALPGFAEDFRTLLIDQPGFGQSDKPPVVGNYFRFSAEAIKDLLDELGLERIHLLGNSLGGGTAARFALLYPERVGRLVLMGPGGLNLSLFHADPTEGVKRLMEFGAAPSEESMRAFISTMVVNQDLVTDELVAERLADATAPGAQEAMQSMGMSFWNPDTLRGRPALARRPPDQAADPAHLGPRGPGEPPRRCLRGAEDDPQGVAARLPELRALGPDRGGRGVPAGLHGLLVAPRRAKGDDVMIDIKSMGYARVASTDLEAWRHFGTKVLGLAEGRGPTEENLYFRIDQVSSRLVVFPSDVDRLDCVGWELADHDALQRAREHLTKAGVEITEGTQEELDERRVQEMVRFTDPFDNVFELFHGITYESRPVVTPYGAKFVTGEQGMGHVVIPVDDDVEALHFYRDVLGFRLRDSMSMPGEFVGKEPGSKVWLRFLGVNPRHHSLAFLPMPNPSRCVHIMFEVEELDDVGRALERVRKHKAPLSATLGRHMNDEMVSFYVRSPGGFDIEFGCEGLTVNDERWVARESTAVSYWGHVFGQSG